jgi:tRNA/rRNA methyltransferase
MSTHLDNLTIVLVKTKFSENVGAAARACANMGCKDLVLVSPAAWDPDKALPMATAKGAEIVRRVRVEDDLATALAPYPLVYAATARTGGWRKGIATPAKAATEIIENLRGGHGAAVVFGPEDRGLTNEEVELCGRIVTIPTSGEASSLNLAQSVLIVLYECLKQSFAAPSASKGEPASRLATNEEQELLFSTIKDTLLAIDFLRDENTDYWMMPMRRFLSRAPLRRSEFNQLMGVCHQINWATGKNKNRN